ncbi:MAG: S8 family peptidase [Chitinophagaceae bacterium]
MNLLKRVILFAAGSLMSLTILAQKKEVPKGWHLLDKKENGYYGISIDKAYQFVKSKNLKSTPVIVAVIDSGVDTLHEDLKPVLWNNQKEIPGNGIDDDNNGYVDDIHGWNFLGGRDGRNVEKDSYEAARVYHKLKSKWEEKDIASGTLSVDEKKEYTMWLKAKFDIVGEINPMEVIQVRRMYKDLKLGDSVIRKDLGKEEYNCKDLAVYSADNDKAKKVKAILTNICKGNDNDDISNVMILDELEGDINKFEAVDRAPKEFRNEIVKDNYADFNDKFYGNNNVMVNNPAALHGTHVSGIIAAARNNGVGIDGIADNVKIMTVRAVPDGDEHDKDIALAIRYAADNGAKVINMSFGKGFSPEKKWVDDAVKYAESKGVLLVHAAGNSHQNLDTTHNFPNPVFEEGGRADNWITVGASGDPEAGGFTASFSNYGKKEVDVFAPGVKIYSTVPGGNTYQNLQGTSMASPVVAGLAAFIIQYFPKLSPQEVKMVIEKSAQNPGEKVKDPGTGEEVDMSELSATGGLVNAYEAIKLASALSPDLKKSDKPVKSKVKQKVKG